MISTTAFIAALKFAAHASAKTDIRTYLKGVLFDFTPYRLVLVGTDGHRLAVASLPGALPFEGEYIAGNESCAHLLALFNKDKKGELTFSRTENGFTVNSSFGPEYAPVLVDGQFPPWRKVVPDSNREPGVMPVIDAQYLADAAKALTPLAVKYGKGRIVPLRIDSAGPNQKIKMRSANGIAIPGIEDAFVVVMEIRE